MSGGAKVMIGFVVGLALAVGAWFAFDFYVIQACANGGGHWDWGTFTCEGGSGIKPPQISEIEKT
jgi:hypothetical protein